MIAEYLPEDRPALIELAQRCLLPEDAMEAGIIVEVLTSAPIGLVTRRQGRIVGAALASIGHRDADVAHLDLLLVDPAHRRQGLTRRLLTELESRLGARGISAIRVAGNPPDYAWPGVDVRYTPAICTLTALGYTHEQTSWNMTADLTVGSPALRETASAVARLAEKAVTVRRAELDDLPELLPMVSGEWGRAWTVEVERAVHGFAAGRSSCHIATRDGEPVAFAAWGGCRPSWFGPMGTLPSAGGLGIGGVLLRLCLRDQAAAGVTEAQIGWVGPVPFYSAVAGARIERVFFLFRKNL